MSGESTERPGVEVPSESQDRRTPGRPDRAEAQSVAESTPAVIEPAEVAQYLREAIAQAPPSGKGRLNMKELQIESSGGGLQARGGGTVTVTRFGVPFSFDVQLKVNVMVRDNDLKAGDIQVKSENERVVEELRGIIRDKFPDLSRFIKNKIAQRYGRGRRLRALTLDRDRLEADFEDSSLPPLAPNTPARDVPTAASERSRSRDEDRERREAALEQNLRTVAGIISKNQDLDGADLRRLTTVVRDMGYSVDLMNDEERQAFEELRAALANV